MTDEKKNDEMTTDTNAGDDALTGTVADADVKDDQPKAPEREPEQNKKSD